MYADLIIKGASIFAGKDLPKDYDFVAIKGDKIIKVGKEDDLSTYTGPETKIIEATKDQLLMPGLHDSHVHLLMAGMYPECLSVDAAKSADEVGKLVAEYAKTIPDREWIIGWRWYHLYWDVKELPTAAILDKYVSDRPVFLMNAELHGCWVNSKAMEICGITKDTPDPAYGKIYRDENGNPTGYLDEMALGIAGRVAFNMSPELKKTYIRSMQESCAAFGITSLNDVLPFFGIELEAHDAIHEMDEGGELKIRIHSAPDMCGDLDKVIADQQKYESDKYKIRNVKQFLDGVATTYTALLVEPYADAPDTHGDTLMDLSLLNGYVEEAHKRGLGVKLHACGDATVRAALDAYENAINKYGANDIRHAIEHCEIIHPDDVNRFGKLGVIASMQPEHIAITEDFASNGYTDRLGPERCTLTWPIKSFMDSGATVAFGTDCPVVTNDPFLELYRAITRVFDDGLPKGGWNPQEILSIEDALHNYTYGSAYAVNREAELGTLEEGKFADMVIIDRNLLTSTPAEVRDAKALTTIFNGEVVYQA